MAKFDRYMLSQLLVLFGFFALVLVAIFWINRAVVLFDRLIGDGQTALVFLEFTALGLPKLIATVLPIATFAAAVYVTNRMMTDSEITVLQATGTGPWRMARPVFVFGLCIALAMAVLSNFLVPMAQAQLKEREQEIAQNVTARLLTEGTFLHPSQQVTFYTRQIDSDGVLRDVFLSDRRDPNHGIIYTAAEAYMVRSGDATTLIMVDGLAQRLEQEGLRLATAKFADFSFDISSLVRSETVDELDISNTTTPYLTHGWAQIAQQSGSSIGSVAEELHTRFARPLFCIVAAMIGFTTLLIGGFSRFGVWREIVFAFALLVVLDGTRGTLTSQVTDNATLWPLLYLPSLIGAMIAALMLLHAARPSWRARLKRRGATA
ncbi:LPS export ABC transporter permease LptF [Sulfitobacter donghicola]|uniref:Permease n=1 Tax=Sulfitobacter donghicola DSW-25 = KCTC 12864 = JCM 14565 TaxID=1300350 RepID=A0A073IIL3_9RHOB|nr:LPS export ABC transporter permease LptF [Sulfitobacter donghicola]KEJ89594.1 permease [Sulfitobacter donghicola DSW-25 = KCTC 12864 = JCM 14565]KIN69431.1 lipopolysaccharide export system permease protein [Sulfitobacter donghicola DSW-25 = KCTC 12864 = JCM 14565]